MGDPDSSKRRHIFPFLLLPYHIRDKIYYLALGYPDLKILFYRFEQRIREVEDQWDHTSDPKCAYPAPRPSPGLMQTPALLLVNRQVAAEAVLALRDMPLVISRYPPRSTTLARPMDIAEFVSEETLRKVQHVVLRIDLFDGARDWCKTVEDLLDTWTTANCLRRVTVWVREMTRDGAVIYWDDGTQSAIKTLSKIRNFVEAENIPLAGNLPEVRLVKKPW